MVSRSPRRSSDGRFKGVGFEDLVIRMELLGDKVDRLEKINAELYLEIAKITREQSEWSGWLYKLYRWLHKTFKEVPKYASEWIEPQDGSHV
jgi:hypothetical protein